MSSPTTTNITSPSPPPSGYVLNNGNNHHNTKTPPPTSTSSSCLIQQTISPPSRRTRHSNHNINSHTNLYNGKLSTTTASNATNNGSHSNNSATTVEDEVLVQITKEAEARLAARRQARAEAREIRLREMERQQKEMLLENEHYEHRNTEFGTPVTSNHTNDHHFSLNIRSRATPVISRESRTSSYTSSRRSSQESLDMCADPPRELRHHINDLEEKFRKAMINNAQLDNEKQSFVYQIDCYKDEIEELEENYLRLQRDFKEKSRNFEQLKRDNERLQFDFKCYKEALEERERLIKEADLVIIRNTSNKDAKLFNRSRLAMANGSINGNIDKDNRMANGDLTQNGDGREDTEDDWPILLANDISLISKDAALMLEDVPGKSLESKLKSMLSERWSLQNTIKELKNDLEEERKRPNSINSTLVNSLHLTAEMQAEIQREASKITNDLRYKLKKSEQENAALSSTVSRLETQVIRLKQATDEAERAEDELKLDKRKTQRELREALAKIEELESANTHLQKRIDKLKSNRNILGMISSSNSSNSNTPPADVLPQNSPLIPSASSGTESPVPSSASDVSTLCSSSTTNESFN